MSAITTALDHSFSANFAFMKAAPRLHSIDFAFIKAKSESFSSGGAFIKATSKSCSAEIALTKAIKFVLRRDCLTEGDGEIVLFCAEIAILNAEKAHYLR